MNKLEKRIKEEGRILPGDILKVDSFLNHLIDIELLDWIGKEFHKRFKDSGANKILTIEASGIPPAVMSAHYFKVPLLFAKKAKSNNLGNQNLYISKVKSYTYENDFYVTVVKDYLNKGDKVLIIDDFLATGEASKGMIDVCRQAGAEVLGVGICVEKGFQPGGKYLREEGCRVESLAIISSLDEDSGKVTLAD